MQRIRLPLCELPTTAKRDMALVGREKYTVINNVNLSIYIDSEYDADEPAGSSVFICCQAVKESEESMEQNTHPIDIDSLVDISTVKIDQSLPKAERIADYIRQIKNPYCYRSGDFVVRISFANTEATLEDRLLSYLQRMTD